MDRALLSSFEHLAEACSAQLAIERSGVAKLRSALKDGSKASPAHYAIHFDLLDAIAATDDIAIQRGFTLLCEVAATADARPPAIVSLDPRSIGAHLAALYTRGIDADAARPLNLMPGATDAHSAARIGEAMDLIDRVAPELGGEVGALARQIVLAADRPDAQHPFYAATSFFLFGAVFFNPERHASAYEAAETLVHEAAHTLLTARAVDAPLVTNPRAARYRAPVRTDPRPMEGIYHATFVLARTCLFNRAVAGSADVPQPLRAIAADAAARDATLFADGCTTVMAEGQLSDLGRALIAQAQAFVAQEPL